MPEHDVLVVGGGFSGMRAAISAREQGARVAILSKLHPLRSHSSGTHSGINASLRGEDSWETHAADTVTAGDHLGEQDVVEALCQEAAKEVIRLEHMGVAFSRDGEGRIDQISFAGSSHPRTCYCGDATGHNLLQVLYEQVLRLDIPIYHERFATSLITDNGACKGVLGRDLRTGSMEAFSAGAVMLATGGIGRMYHPSTSSLGATADGVALAYGAGAQLRDMEMVQYAPTTLKNRGLLISEAARSAGAKLVDGDGKDIGNGSGASTNDHWARAVNSALSNGDVYLDFREIDSTRLAKGLSETRALVKDLGGIDLTKEPVPVRPAMHRPIGGIKTDAQGATSIAGLYAAGECANTGVHGANRLGGNSLLECVVMGSKAGAAAASHGRGASKSGASSSVLSDEENRIKGLLSQERGEDTPGGLLRELSATMNGNVGISRDEGGLNEASANIAKLRERYEKLGVQNSSGTFNADLTTVLELGNMLDAAGVIVAASRARQESRGTHYRSDFPNRDDANWHKHTIAIATDDGPKLEYEPVTVTLWPLGGKS